MKTYFLRATLAMMLCSTAICGWGQGTSNTIFEDDFSSLSSFSNNDPVTSLTNWSAILYCKRSFNVNLSNPALKIERERQNASKPVEGYATTDALDYVGDAYLSFSHAYTASNKPTKAKIILSENAVFKENNSNNIEVDVSSNMTTKFNSATLHLLNISNNTTITFQSTSDNYYAIDNVKVTKIPVISLAESTDNDNTIEHNAESVVMVNTHRTLTGGIWNTLCLPFDVTMADMVLALGNNQDIQLRTFSSYADNVMTFANANETTIPAGTPFLIKLNTTVENPTFHAVTISNTDAKAIGDEGSIQFVGTYSPIALATDGTNLFITRNNTLAQPAEGKNTMNGLRAYIAVPEDFDSSDARLMMDDGEATAISDLAPSAVPMPKATYNLKGQRVENARRGLYVVNGKLTLVK